MSNASPVKVPRGVVRTFGGWGYFPRARGLREGKSPHRENHSTLARDGKRNVDERKCRREPQPKALGFCKE